MVERWKTDRQEIPPLLFGLLVLMEVEQAGDDDKRRTVGRKKEKLPPAPRLTFHPDPDFAAQGNNIGHNPESKHCWSH